MGVIRVRGVNYNQPAAHAQVSPAFGIAPSLLFSSFNTQADATAPKDLIGRRAITATGLAAVDSAFASAPARVASFNGSSSYASVALDLSGQNRITLSFWMNWTTFANDDDLALEFTSNGATTNGGFLIDPNESSSGNIQITCKGSGNPAGVQFTRPSAGAWHHYLIGLDVSAAATTNTTIIPFVYVDGVAQSLTGVGSPSNTGVAFSTSTLYFMCRNAAALFGAGQLARFDIIAGLRSDLALPLFLSPWQLFEPGGFFVPIQVGGGGGSTYNESASETASLTDTPIGALMVAVAARGETASLTDTPIGGLMVALGVRAETLATAAEAWASLATMAGAVSESVSGTSGEEGTKASNSYDEPVAETVTVSDTPAALIVAVGAAAETVSVSDTPAGLMVASAAASESVSTSDTPAALAAMSAAVSEGVTTSDAGAVGASTYNAPVSESVVVWDSPDATGGNGVPNAIRQGHRILTPGTLKATR